MTDKQSDLNALFCVIERLAMLLEDMKVNANNIDFYKSCKREVKEARQAYDRIDKALEHC